MIVPEFRGRARIGAGLFILAAALACAQPSTAADVAGSADHPVVSRYPGSQIRWYDVEAFARYAIATGPVTGYRAIDQWTETQGRTTRIYYELAGQKTHAEVHANYRKALLDSGFTLLAEGLFPKSSQASEVGSRKWLGVHYGRNTIDPDGIRLLHGSSTSGGSGFLAGRAQRAAGTVFVVIGLAQYSQELVATLIDVIEVDDAETGLVTINADAMSRAIDEFGRVTLDGLYFDHDKATLTAQSKPALDEIAKFLKSRPEKSFYVVGHTDATGGFAYNRTLSENRAAAVVHELTRTRGIRADRLEAHGVGPLAPVQSNAADKGRARNRRVELVER